MRGKRRICQLKVIKSIFSGKKIADSSHRPCRRSKVSFSFKTLFIFRAADDRA